MEIFKKLPTTDQIVEAVVDRLVPILTMTKLSTFKSVKKGQKVLKKAKECQKGPKSVKKGLKMEKIARN